MKKILFVLLLAASALSAVENPDTLNGGWVKKFNTAGDSSSAFRGFSYKVGMTGTPSSQLYGCGLAYHSGGLCSMAVVSYNYYGTLSWSRHYGIQSGCANGCWHGGGDTLWVTGYCNGTGYWQTYKINSATGDTIEGKRISLATGSYGNNIMGDYARHIYAVGQKYNGTNYDACLIKYRDSAGVLDTVWTRTWNGDSSSHDYGYGVYVWTSNEIYITGKSNRGVGRGYDAFVAKYDNNGNLIWSKTYDNLTTGGYNEQGNYITRGDTFLYITGGWSSATTGQDMCVLKCRRGDGALLNNWSWSCGTSGTEAGYQLVVADNPNTWGVMTGSQWTGSLYKMAAIKFNKNTGDTIWQRFITGAGGSFGYGGLTYGLDNAYVVGNDNAIPTTAKMVHYKWLLPQPTLVQPIDSFNTGATITFKWRNQTYLDTFRIQISTDTSFTTLLVDSLRTTNAPDTQFIFTPTADDTFYWRVKGYDYNGVTQIDSTYWSDRHWVIEDRTAPNINSSLKADNGKPSPWSPDTTFAISYTALNPNDMSGIRACYKLGTTPSSATDTSGSSTLSNPFNINSAQRRQWLWVWLKDGAGNVNFGLKDSVLLRYDNTIPTKVTSLTAAGANPSPWRSDSSFSISFTSPADTSGIMRHYTKLGSTPTGPGDTSGAKFSTKPFTVYSSIQGNRWLYVWEQDSAGNSGWQNRDSVKLRFDNVAPGKPQSITMPWPFWSSVDSSNIVFNNPSDTSRIYRTFYKVGNSPTGPFDTTHTSPNSSFWAHTTAQGGQWCYIWLQDSAGNVNNANRDSVRLLYDVTTPTVTVNQPGSGTTWYCGTNQSIQWTQTDSGAFKRDSVIYSTDGGSTWNYIWTGAPATSRIWTIPNTPSTNCRVRVYARDSVDLMGYGTSATFTIADTAKPTITVTAPNGGETWYCGASSNYITWNHYDGEGAVYDSLFYSIDNGAHWNFVFYNSTGGQSYQWSIPNTPSTNCLVKVKTIDASGNWAVDVSNAVFTIADTIKPTAHVTSPNGGENWPSGSQQTIAFTQSDNAGIREDSVYYSTNGGAGWTSVFGGGVTSSITFWLPNIVSVNCLAKVVVIDSSGNKSSDVSDNIFSIVDTTKPQVTVSVPNGGQTWYCGTQQNLYWSSYDNIGVVGDSVFLSTDNGASWSFQVNKSGRRFKDGKSSGVSWMVPNIPSIQCLIKVKVWDSVGNWRADQSDADFTIADTIKPSMVTVVAPQPSDIWPLQSTQSVQWTQSDNVGVAFDSLLYSLDGGTSWNYIAKIAAASSYSWTLPNQFSKMAGIKVVAIDGSGNKKEDASGFTISDTSGPSVTVNAPNGGESWQALSGQTITWAQSDNFAVVSDSIYFTADGTNWSPVWGGAATTNYLWSVPNPPSTTCKVKVVAFDGYGNRTEDASNNNFVITASTINITVTSPNGGESYTPNGALNVTWTQSANVTSDTVLISTDGGSWSQLWGGATTTATTAVVPNTPSTQCRIKVIAVENAGNKASDISDHDFTIYDIDAPAAAVTWPNGGEHLSVGTTQNITWTQSDNVLVAGDSLWLFDGGTFTLLYAGVPKTSQPWQVPMTPGSPYWIKVKAWDASGNAISDQSDNPFSIVDTISPTVQLNAPTGSEVLSIGSNYPISWNQNDNIGVVVDTLQYSTDGGATWSLIWTGLSTTYSWTVPNSPSSNCLVRIIAVDGSGNKVQSTSGTFTIRDNSTPIVTVTSPSGPGVTWYCGTSQSISWTQSDNTSVTADSVFYSVNNGTSWSLLYGGSATTGNGWTVPNINTSQALVLVRAYDAAGNLGADTSAVFAISDSTKPTTAIVQPNGGENMAGGVSYLVVWSRGDNLAVTLDSLDYSIDNGVSWNFVWKGVKSGSVGTYNWTVLNTPSTQCRMKVTVKDSAGNSASDASDGVFTIVPGSQPQLAVSPDSISIQSAGGSDSITVSNTGDATVINYTVSKDSSWLSVSQGSGHTPGGFTVFVDPNNSGSDRTGHVTVNATSLGQSQVIKIVQPSQDVTAPSVTVSAPNGGETWDIGNIGDIAWSQNDNVGVTVDSVLYSTNNGTSWIYIWSGTSSDNTYHWSIPATPSVSAMVKVMARDAAGNWGQDSSDAVFTIRDNTAPTLNINQPGAGVTWNTGSSHNITWNQSDNVGVAGDSVFYNVNNGSWIPLYSGAATSSYSWSIPNIHSTQCKVRVVAWDNAGNKVMRTSAGIFTIADTIAPAVMVATPNGGETWGVSIPVNIRWHQSDNIRVMQDSLYYSVDAGASWTYIDAIGADSSYPWTVPNNPSTLCRVKLVAIDTAGNKTTDISNADFTITASTTPCLSVDADSILFGYTGGGDSIAVTNTGDTTIISYTISADSGWIGLSQAGGSTPGGFSIILGTNSTGSNRMGNVIIDGGAIPGSPDTVVVFQTGQDITSPTVAVTTPNGGETWGIGTPHIISWSQGDNSGVSLDSLFYSTNGGTVWTFLWSGLDSSYNWSVPNANTSDGLVRVAAYDAAGNSTTDVSDGTFTIRDLTAPTVTVTSPDGGEIWGTGSSHTIYWTQDDNVGVAVDSVHYSTDNGLTWIPIYGGAATASYGWTIPNLNSSQCLVRVTAYDAMVSGVCNSAVDASNGTFTIRDTIAPTVTVLAPNGGQSLTGNVSYQVRWNKSDNIGVVSDTLAYSTDNGSTWQFVWGGLAPSGTYNWTVPNTPSIQCFFRAIVADAAGNKTSDISDAKFTINAASQPYLAVTPPSWNAPAAGGSFYVKVSNTGNTSVIIYAITADSSWIGQPGGGATPDSFLVTLAANSSGATRSGHVTVTATGTPGSPQVVTVTQPSQDASAPTVTVIAPNGGETWGIGSIHLINWNQHDDVGVIRDTVQYSTDNCATWTFLSAGAGVDTFSYWTVPSTPTTAARVRVIVRDAAGNRSVDTSDAPFVIRDDVAPLVTVILPHGGETWNTGTACMITWTQSDNIGVIADSIYYSTDNGFNWTPVYSGAATTSYSWTVPNTPSAACLIRVVAIDSAGNRTPDASDAVFRINDNIAPIVTLISPNGGQTWSAGSTDSIRWTQSDNVNVAQDSIYFSSDSMATWTPVAGIPAATSYGWTVAPVVSGICFVRVVAIDASGNRASDASDAKFGITIPDITAPRLYAQESDNAAMTYGTDFIFKAKAADTTLGASFGIGQVKLEWRQAGYPAMPLQSVTMYSMGDSSYFYQLLGSLVPRQGIQYRITAYDASGNTTVHPATGLYHHPAYNGQITANFPYDQWRMVSFPAALSNAPVYPLLQDDLGSYDKTKWRLYEYNANQYIEYGSAGFRTYQSGKAYWLRQRVGQSVTVDVDNALSVAPTAGVDSVPLVNGWVDVGDPYFFNVRWRDIYAATGDDTMKIQALWSYGSSGWQLQTKDSVIAPWQGYSVKASGSGWLKIPAMVAAKGQAKQDGLWPNGWIGTITVSSGHVRDDNYFGIGQGTTMGVDKCDYPEPPSGLTGVSGYFTIGENQYASDLRPVLGAGQTWEFTAASQPGANTITVQLPTDLPKGTKTFLADLSDQLTQEVTAGGRYEYRPASGNERRGFKLIVGNDAYAQAEIDKAFTPPAVTLLEQNRPNPVSAKTLINYQLAQGGKVELTVYNIVGQKVRTLVNAMQKTGRYRVTWDGSNDNGNRLSNGVYFYRLSARDAVQTRKLTIIR